MPVFRFLPLLLFFLLLGVRPGKACALEPVLTGLDVLKADNFQPLRGLRVGVITNHTGLDRAGESILDLLAACPDVRLAAVFAPEHGLKGRLDSEYGHSNLTGKNTPVYSLYGKTRKPDRQWLDGLDILVFDIQDIGTRFYTYITTLALAMQAASEAGIGIMVLDRPNPIGGLAVEGPVLEDALQGNFIAYYPIPVRHGLTVGELAGLFNSEFGIGAKLTVIRMRGWQRPMLWEDTGLKWVDPSPNMRSPMAALLYPGLGIAEAANLSVGRGTDRPFEIYGAPWITEGGLAGILNSAGLPGVRFVDTTFTPSAYLFKGEACRGVRAEVTDSREFHSLDAGLHFLSTLQRLHPDKFDLSKIDLWIGRRDVKDRIRRGEPADSIAASWNEGLELFKPIREKYLLY